MYQYTAFDSEFVKARAAQYRDQLTRNLAGKLADDDFRPLRLQNGWYVQRYAPMLRVAVPYGELNSAQLRVLATIARDYDRPAPELLAEAQAKQHENGTTPGPRLSAGYGHFTTRQNVQFNWIPLEKSADVMDLLATVNLHGIQTSGNCIRNTTSDERAGIAVDEDVDPRPYAELIRQWSTLHPEFAFLPRKFKIAIAIPPYNDSDIFSQDLGFIAIVEKNRIIGYNVIVGGGMGTTFGMPETYPRLAEVIGFCTPEQIVDVAEKVLLVQRDNGNRQNRKLSRLKYTIDRLGIDAFKAELHKYLGYELQEPKPFAFTRNGDRLGWKKGADSKWSLSLFVEGGRVADKNGFNLKSALRETAQNINGQFILTGNQNLVIANVSADEKKKISEILKKNGVLPGEISGLRQNSIACVALNTCGLAFAEAERYLPSLISKIESILDQHGLFKEEIVIRMTGCPNGCGRPYLAEIGFVGKSEGHYNLYLGGNFNGTRLNTLYKETLTEDEILAELSPIVADYAQSRSDGEKFGDFVIRKQYVKEILKGSDFRH